MKLANVRDLKEELLASPKVLTERLADIRSFSAFVERDELARENMSTIALGVSPRAHDYRLAVRLQRSGPLVSALAEQISARAGGEVDVRYVGDIVKFATATQPAFYQQRRRPLRIGLSISDSHKSRSSAGTLGCFVVDREPPHDIGILTNNHVIANENRNKAGEPVVQPGTFDGGAYPADSVATLGRFIPLRVRAKNLVDAAVGHLDDDIEYEPWSIGNLGELNGQGNVAKLPSRAAVFKVGRTTGQTEGRVTAFDVDNVRVQYDMGVLRFDGQIEIEGVHNRAFSDSGDSGSLVVDRNLDAIGLVFAGGDQGGSNGKGLTYANPIDVVLDLLKVKLEL